MPGAPGTLSELSPHKRQQIRNLLRSHAEQFADFVPIHDHVVLRCVKNQDGIDELIEILI